MSQRFMPNQIGFSIKRLDTDTIVASGWATTGVAKAMLAGLRKQYPHWMLRLDG